MHVLWKAPQRVALEPQSEGGQGGGGTGELGGEDVELLEGMWPPWAGCLGVFVFHMLHTHGPIHAPLGT